MIKGEILMQKRKPRALANLVIFIPLILIAFPICWALWFMFGGALMPIDELIRTIGPVVKDTKGFAFWPLLPSWPTLQPLTQLLLDTPEFFSMFWNSFRITIPAVVGQLVIGAPAAWALSRFRFRGRKILFTLYIVLMLMPFQVTMVPNYLVIDGLGLMDTIWAVALPFAFSAYPVFIMSKNFDAVPRAILEAASIDGASYLLTFFKIGLPLGMPGIISALVLGFLECWNAIEQPLIFIKSEKNLPLSLFLSKITTDNLGLSMVASLIMLMPALLIFLFGQKYLELGIQAAGVKE